MCNLIAWLFNLSISYDVGILGEIGNNYNQSVGII